jgi:hypothetical protein
MLLLLPLPEQQLLHRLLPLQHTKLDTAIICSVNLRNDVNRLLLLLLGCNLTLLLLLCWGLRYWLLC